MSDVSQSSKKDFITRLTAHLGTLRRGMAKAVWFRLRKTPAEAQMASMGSRSRDDLIIIQEDSFLKETVDSQDQNTMPFYLGIQSMGHICFILVLSWSRRRLRLAAFRWLLAPAPQHQAENFDTTCPFPVATSANISSFRVLR